MTEPLTTVSVGWGLMQFSSQLGRLEQVGLLTGPAPKLVNACAQEKYTTLFIQTYTQGTGSAWLGIATQDFC